MKNVKTRMIIEVIQQHIGYLVNCLFHLFNIFQLIIFSRRYGSRISQEPFLCLLRRTMKMEDALFRLEESAFGYLPPPLFQLLLLAAYNTLHTLYLNNGTMQQGSNLWFGSHSLYFKQHNHSVGAECLALSSSYCVHVN